MRIYYFVKWSKAILLNFIGRKGFPLNILFTKKENLENAGNE